MSQGGGVVLHVGVGWSSQELVSHQKSRGHHPAFDRSEVVSKTDSAGLLLMLPAQESKGGVEVSPFAAGIWRELHICFSTFMSSVTRYVDLFMLNWNMRKSQICSPFCSF